MSRFTGKCDFFDTISIHGSEEVMKAHIFMGNAIVKITDEKDLIPYYTNLVSSMCGGKDGFSMIRLAQDSYIDQQEAEQLGWRVRDAIMTARKAKKDKQPLTVEMLIENDFTKSDKRVWEQIFNIIQKYPEIVKVHLPKNFNEMSFFIERWIVPEYFSHIHFAWQNEQRKQFLQFVADNGFYTFDKEMKPLTSDKRYHPLIVDMCYKVVEYEKE